MSRGRKKRLGLHSHVWKCARVLVAIRDWGPLTIDELVDDTGESKRSVIASLVSMRNLGYVKRFASRGGGRLWHASDRYKDTDGGLELFGSSLHGGLFL